MTRLPTTPNPNSWRAKLGGAVRGGAAARTILTTVRIRRIGGRGTPGGDGGNGGVALWQQGAEELYSSELVAKRAAARHDVAVLDVLQTWWDTARRSMMLGDSSKICEVPEIQYVAMMKKIYRVVIDEYDEGNNNNYLVVTGASLDAPGLVPSFAPSLLVLVLVGFALSLLQKRTRD